MGDLTKKLIENVRKYPILYDPWHTEYRNVIKKDEAWRNIAKELQEDSESVRGRWKNLRDCFIKFKNFQKGSTGLTATKYKKWKWSSQMEFLDFPLTPGPAASNVMASDASDMDIPQPSPAEGGSEESQSLPAMPPSPKRIKKRESKEDVERKRESKEDVERKRDSNVDVDKVFKYFANKIESKKKTLASFDEVDLLFLSYAKTFKRFSARRQVTMKVELANTFAHAELSELDEQAI